MGSVTSTSVTKVMDNMNPDLSQLGNGLTYYSNSNFNYLKLI